VFCFVGVSMLVSCAPHAVHSDPQPLVSRDYVDLQPGWRIRVVTPIQKSGEFKVQFKKTAESGIDNVVQTAGDDFLGYELSYYTVRPREGTGIKIVFSSADLKKQGKTVPESHPVAALFELPENLRHVRLVFLTRLSTADHNQAILASSSLDQLDTLTNQVRANPVENCTRSAEFACSWIPEGIAVQPEKPESQHGKKWIPAS
jgi:hypothetical protein